MKFKILQPLLLLFFTCFLSNGLAQNPIKPPYKNPELPVGERIRDLLSRMTLQEKVIQLQSMDGANMTPENIDRYDTATMRKMFGTGIGAIQATYSGINETVETRNHIQRYLLENTRLGIPALFIDEGLHGLLKPEATSFPQAIGLACSWDPKLFRDVFAVTAAEMRSRGAHHALSPVIDVCRDPRWGRCEETYGEDPYLNGILGTAAVIGFQGSATGVIAKNHVGATLKHFTGHGQPENGQNQAPANYSERILREVHMRPFEMVIRNAKPAAVMPAYVELDGIPCHANEWLLKKILRKEWGFNGLVASDFGGIEQLWKKHFVAGDAKKAAELAFNAGVDCDFPIGSIYPNLLELLNDGIIKARDLDSSVARVLREKFLLGLFENPYADAYTAREVSELESSRQLALHAAHESMVLLKNENHLLPLSKDKYKKIAVIGPCAAETFLGGYSGEPYKKVSLYDGIKKKVGSHAEVVFSQGCKITTNYTSSSHENWANVNEIIFPTREENEKYIHEAVEVAKTSDIIILAIGEYEQICREAWSANHHGDAATLDLISDQDDLVKAMVATGKPVIVYLVNGRPLSINYVAHNVPAIIEGWYMGQEAGTAAADIIFGDVNPSGKITISFPKTAGQIPLYYNHKPSAHPIDYVTVDTKPLYPFGFGLSYTSFTYSNLRLSQRKMNADGSVTVSADITNTGKIAGDETAQLYIRDKVSSVTRPIKELRGFERISLQPGQTKSVFFTIDKSSLAFWDGNMNFSVEPGFFDIMIGSSSEDLKSIELLVE
jgi:beta-glucosidase